MGFAIESGYTPATIEDMMDSVMTNYNTQFGTAYTTETFIGTNAYKYWYALMQRLQENEVKTAEIFVYLQQYFTITNERISRPVVTNPGLVDMFLANGYIASVKKPIDADAGKVFICVDTDEDAAGYAATKLAICNLIKDSTVAGAVTQGTETEAIVLSNGQSFDFKFNLPDRIHVALRLTTTLSENNQVVVGNPSDVKLLLFNNIVARYQLGKNFEPERYFAQADAPWTSTVLLEWSDDVTETSPGVWELGMSPTWHDEVYDAAYDDLFIIALDLIELVEA